MQKATTLLIEAEGMTNRQRYVFQVLNDVSRTYMETKGRINYLVENTTDDRTPLDIAAGNVKYVRGHLVMSDDFDEAIIQNYSTCGSYNLFVKDEEDDEDILYGE